MYIHCVHFTFTCIIDIHTDVHVHVANNELAFTLNIFPFIGSKTPSHSTVTYAKSSSV